VAVDVRIIATSNRDLAAMVARGEFRADLYYRLSVFPLCLPPLRQRRDDIPALAAHLTEEIAGRLGRPAPALAAEAIDQLLKYDFPGNVRELANVLERVLVRCRGGVVPGSQVAAALSAVGISSLGADKNVQPVPSNTTDDAADRAMMSLDAAGIAGAPPRWPLALADLERMAILEALRRERGNRTHAARLLGISLRTLRNKLRLLRVSGELGPEDSLLASRPTAPTFPKAKPAPTHEESAA
jgi:two-component system response regulator PilR (NtrC family)